MIRLSAARPIVTTPHNLKDEVVVSVIPVENASLATVDQPPAIRRLVVLVPDVDVDETRFATKLWSMALGLGLNLVFLGLARDTFREARVVRRLATLAAITCDKRIQVETRVATGTRWEPAIRSIWQAGDLLVCHAEQSKSVFGIGREPLASALASKLKVPVYALAGFYPELPPELPEGVRQIFAALPLVAIITVFFFVLVGIQRLTTGLVQTGLLCLSVIVTYSLIAAWETFVTSQNN